MKKIETLKEAQERIKKNGVKFDGGDAYDYSAFKPAKSPQKEEKQKKGKK